VGEELSTWREAYRMMLLLRRFEETVQQLYRQALLPGFVHLYIGAEASAVGVCGVLEQGDAVFSNHRPHGHCLAAGANPEGVFAELYGYSSGLCGGKSGSMHLVDLEHGFFGANGIVGAGLALALGPALHAQLDGSANATVVFFGDGASNQGAFHESLNLAAVWQLPIVFVCENDGYAEATPREHHQRIDTVSRRADAYGIPGVTVDGQDVRAVRGVATEALRRARNGKGPTLLECLTIRYGGHFEGDQLGYHLPNHRDEAHRRDPIDLLKKVLVSELGASQDEIAADEEHVRDQVDEALAKAQEGSPPPIEEATRGLYASEVGVR
jgi:acetoin:2,6-dichlorophenolindophenol oxidoreductase subunit alpha